MKRIYCILILFLTLAVDVYCQQEDQLVVAFWNLENFFDHVDQGKGDSDREFSSFGSRHWTKKRFQAKCDAVAKSIMWMGDRYGHLPDLIGLAEVESRAVLAKLLRSTLLRKHDYEIVHHESGDRRGIDVAILYRKSAMRLDHETLKTPEMNGQKLATRDILHVEMCLTDSSKLHFIVNHHPSKYGGEKESEGPRHAAMTALKEICDSLENGHIIAMGDFNDTPDADSFRIIDGTLFNMGTSLHEKGEGSIRYEGRWDLIDMFMISPSIAGASRMEICRIPFLMTWEKKHPGEKPFRTYSGPRYIGGVSDHCPIVLIVDRKLMH